MFVRVNPPSARNNMFSNNYRATQKKLPEATEDGAESDETEPSKVRSHSDFNTRGQTSQDDLCSGVNQTGVLSCHAHTHFHTVRGDSRVF